MTKADADAADVLEKPTNIILNYDSSKHTVVTAATASKAPWYDATLYKDVEIKYTAKDQENNSANDTSKAGEYDVELKIKDTASLVWADATTFADKTRTIKMTITPAPITVTFPESGDFTKNNNYAYHADESGKHKLKFPDTEEVADTRSIIKLVDDEGSGAKKNVTIKYIVKTHAEKDHETWIKDVETKLAQLKETDDWEEYSSSNSTMNVSAVGGYCVFYKISAENHEDEYGYFSYHIFTEILKITMSDYDLGTKTYGYEFKTQAELYTLINSKVTAIEDQYHVSRKDDLMKPENEKKFEFYFTETAAGGGSLYKTKDDGGTIWDAGTYYLQVRYKDGNESYISFEWGDKSVAQHPRLKIDPKEVVLTWIGNTNWENDKDNKASSAGDVTDQYCFVYDGTGKTLTATYNAKLTDDAEDDIKTLDADNISLKSGEGINVAEYTVKAENLKNFTFSNSEKTFKVVKAKNGWKQGTAYSRDGWGVDDSPKPETLPEPLFGDRVTVTYLVDKDGEKQPYTPQPDFEAGTYYAKLHVDGNNNYDAIDEVQESSPFVVGEHQHRWSGWKSNATSHWIECELCHTHDREEAHTKQSATPDEDDDNLHKLTCSVCKLVYKSERHNFGEYSTVKPSTCTVAGTEEATCECGKTDVRDKDLQPHEYTVGEYEFDSEHPELGHYQICNNCHEKSEAVAHDYQPISAVAPTCVSKGKSAGSQCSVCKHYETEPTDVPMLPHDYDESLTKTIAATCTTDGSTIKHCKTCDSDVPEVIAALGHDYGEFETTKAATCTAKGKKQQTCSRCNDVHEEDIPAMGHDFTKHDRVEPTATETGNIEYYECSICEKCYRDQEGNNEVEKSKTVLPALGTGSGGGNQSLGGDTGLGGSGTGGSGSSGASDFLEKNWLWIVLALAAILVVAIVFGIVAGVMRRRREQRFMEMMARSQGGYQPMSNMQYPADGQRPIFVIGQPSGENGQQTLQLPSGLDEETLANAIALAMQKVNANKPQESDNADVDGFYDDVEDDGFNGGNGGNGGFDGGNGKAE